MEESVEHTSNTIGDSKVSQEFENMNEKIKNNKNLDNDIKDYAIKT
jgi:hypothetical protein